MLSRLGRTRLREHRLVEDVRHRLPEALPELEHQVRWLEVEHLVTRPSGLDVRVERQPALRNAERAQLLLCKGMLRARALELLLERRRERRVLELDSVLGYALALVLPLEAERRSPLGHKGHHALAGVGLGLDAQPVERHERRAARARLLELLDEFGRYVVAVDDHV